ncbi:MAG: membrane protein insertase YidC [Candidatus Cryptobacteroides sp.]
MNSKTSNIIGIVLIGLIMFGFTFYQSRQYKKQAEARYRLDSIARVERLAQLALDSAYRAEHGDSVDVTVAMTPVARPVMYKDSLLTEARKANGHVFKLENELLAVEINTKGAQPHSVKVKNYKSYDSTELYLIPAGQSSLGYQVYAGENINTKDFVFNVTEATDSSITLQLPFAQGGKIQQKYTLKHGSYMVDSEVAFIGMDGIIPRNVTAMDIDWTVNIPRLEKGYKNEKQYSKLDYYFSGEKKPEEIGRGRDASKSVNARMKWFAFQQQFFSAIMTSQNEFASADLAVKYFPENDASHNLMNCSARLRQEFQPAEKAVVIPFSFYFGPNDIYTLKQYDLKYDKIVPLGGWLVGWFSRYVILPTFNFLGKFINSFGIIILIMTILLKLVVSPLTIKSYMSSAKMQVLKPEMEKLNEKYPDQKDAMKKQQAVMDLYRKAGINPMGGCLPMLLQFPILWAMFRFFPACIDLRQQSFLWAKDLSAYDSILDFGFNIPLYGDHISLFALLMAVSMFLYSKMTMSGQPKDPNMAAMNFMSVWMMPIMMLFICNNLSSALSYYYLLSNLITMLQTWVIKKWVVKPEKILAQIKAAPSKSQKKSKWQLRLEEAQRMQEQMAKQKRK